MIGWPFSEGTIRRPVRDLKPVTVDCPHSPDSDAVHSDCWFEAKAPCVWCGAPL